MASHRGAAGDESQTLGARAKRSKKGRTREFRHDVGQRTVFEMPDATDALFGPETRKLRLNFVLPVAADEQVQRAPRGLDSLLQLPQPVS